MHKQYTPVNCNFYDELEALATLQRPCEIIFLNNGSKSVIHGKIADLYVRESVEFVKMASGLEIRLDKLVEVDGKAVNTYC